MAAARHRFRPEQRVRSKRDYERAFESGVSVRDANVKVVARRNALDGGPTRLGTAISRRGGGASAAARNRLRRLYREAFRRVAADLPRGLDLILVPVARPGGAADGRSRAPRLTDIERSLAQLARRADAKLAPEPTPSPSPAAQPEPGGATP